MVEHRDDLRTTRYTTLHDSSTPCGSSSTTGSNQPADSSSTAAFEPLDQSKASVIEITVICVSIFSILLFLLVYCLYRQHHRRMSRRREDSALLDQPLFQSDHSFVHCVETASNPPFQIGHSACLANSQPVLQHSYPSSTTQSSFVTETKGIPHRSLSNPLSNPCNIANITHPESNLTQSKSLTTQSLQSTDSHTNQSFVQIQPYISASTASTDSGPNQLNYRFTKSSRLTGSLPDVDSCYENDDELSDADSMEGEDLISQTEQVDEAELISKSLGSVQCGPESLYHAR